MKEIVIRFVIGGVAGSFFALLGDVFKPKRFAGLFGAAPSVAIATLALTIKTSGAHFAAVEATSMMVSAVAFFVYASCVCWTMMRRSYSALRVTMSLLTVWAAGAFGLWYVVLR